MIKRNLWIPLGAFLIWPAALAGVHYYNTHKTKPVLAAVSPDSPVTTESVVDNPDVIQLVNAVTVTSPFEAIGMTTPKDPVTFEVPANESFAAIGATTSFKIPDNQIVLSSNFVEKGPSETSLDSKQQVSLTERITFVNGGSIVWAGDDASANPAYSWATHPDHVLVPTGGTAVVTYSNNGSDGNWVGSVSVE